MYKSMIPMKNCLNIHILFTGLYKSFPIHGGLWGWGFFKHILENLYCTKCTKLIRFLRCTVAGFIYRNTRNISNTLWAMTGNGWICILNCAS